MKKLFVKILDDGDLSKQITSSDIDEHVFGKREDLCSSDYILQNKFNYIAKICDANYALKGNREVDLLEHIKSSDFMNNWNLLPQMVFI